MASTPTKLMTVAEWDHIPNPPGGVYELYHGEPVKVAFAKAPHTRGQWQIRRLLESAAGDAGVVKEEMPFRPVPEYECWAADVALVSHARWNKDDDWLMGPPELVVEIISPSNSLRKLRDKACICLENGTVEFWIVDLRRREVSVLTPRGETVYAAGERIPLYFGGEIAVAEIFR
ncbi:MAG: Uma2 family endonuclease [Bryobacterales bacterium]|nr:Uma2 family endonuclease [Bryobacterales bacterium]MBV9398270.1 Uma2 family endonuclease [Bryobacterales bacterium]